MISLTARRASCYTRTRSTHRQQRAIVTASTQSGETNAPATATGTARSAVNTSGPLAYIPFTVTQQQADFRYDSLYDSMFYRRFGATRNTAKSATCQRIFVPVHILEADFDVVCDYEGAASTSGSALPPAATPLRRPDSFNARLFRTLQAEIADDVVADMMHARAAVHDDDAKSMTQTLRRRVALSGFQQKEYVCDSSYEALISKIMNATAGMNKNDGEDMLPPSLLSLPQSLITSMEILRKTQHRGSTANAHDGASSLDLRRIPLRLVPPPPSIVAGAEAEAVTAGSTPISENRPFIPSTIVHDALDEFSLFKHNAMNMVRARRAKAPAPGLKSRVVPLSIPANRAAPSLVPVFQPTTHDALSRIATVVEDGTDSDDHHKESVQQYFANVVVQAANAEVAAALHPLILADPSLRLRRLDIETFRNLRVVKLYLPFYVFSTTSKKPLKTYISGYNTYTLGQERYSLGASAAVAAAFTLSYDKLMPRITVSDIFAAAADTIKGLKPFAESVTDTVVPSSGSMTFGETVLFVSLTMMLVDGINDRKTRAYDRLENNPHALRMAFNAFAEEVRKSGLRQDFFDQRPAYKVRAEQEVERLRRLAEEQVRQRHEAAEAAKRAAATAEEERRRQQLAKEEAERLQREHEAEEERRRQSAAADYLRRPTDPRGYYAFLGVQPNATKEEIELAFRARARLYHPDMVSDLEGKRVAKEQFQKLVAIGNIMRNDAQRRQYDDSGK